MARGAAAAGGSAYYADLVRRRAARVRLRDRRGAGRARLRLLLRPRRPGAGRRLPGARVARLRPDPGRDRVGAREPARDRVRAEPRVPAAAVRRRRLRLRLRHLDLEPLRRGRGARLAARDAPHRQAGRAARAHHARHADDRPHPARGRALVRAAQRGARLALRGRASGTRPSSASRATTASPTPTGAPPS